jgi:hypothetical protein
MHIQEMAYEEDVVESILADEFERHQVTRRIGWINWKINTVNKARQARGSALGKLRKLMLSDEALNLCPSKF